MTLLHLLVKQANSSQLRAKSSTSSVELVVAHFNHGIRPDSAEDEKLVARAAKKYNLPFEVGYGNLGQNASEDVARAARYKFLETVAKKHRAKGIITAHHQDDLIETAFINILRGTGRTGLSSIRNSKIYRPLLDIPKKEILAYAKSNKIQWREDETNSDTIYLRNYIRQKITKNLDVEKRQKIISNLDKVAKINKIINQEIATLSQNRQELDRQEFIMLPSEVSDELLIHWLRTNNLKDFNRKTITRLSTAIKTAKAGTRHKVIKNRSLVLTKTSAILR